jgi:hypothetical protein
MSGFAEQKRLFYRELVSHAISEPRHFRDAFPLGADVPHDKMERWLGRFLRVPETFGQEKYINRFKLGADPEFVFVSQSLDGPVRVDAHTLGLKQGPAFGEDNNGRLTEIRPYPDRSALKVVASTLVTLRWLYLMKPKTQAYQWVAGAYIMDDGLGGHVHFGRKRPTRVQEVKALDNLNELLMGAKLFPEKEVSRRRQGDARRQLYGLPGDFRLQTHGYEYRTFPSWLDSPAMAFLTITLSKLAVHDPTLLQMIKPSTFDRFEQAIRNILAYYKDADDDARLAYIMLQRGFPRHLGADFKERWGLRPNREGSVTVDKTIGLIPMAIEPMPSDITELFAHFLTGAPLTLPTKMAASWSPVGPPKGYKMVLDRTETLQQKGLGEMIWDLCMSEEMPLVIQGKGPSGVPVNIPRAYMRDCNLAKLGLQDVITVGSDAAIRIAADWRDGARGKMVKKALLSGIIPLWKVSEVKEDSFALWKLQPKWEPKYITRTTLELGGR